MNLKVVVRVGMTLGAVLLASCSAVTSNKSLSAPEQIVMSKMDVNRYPVSKLVCDPMDDGGDDPRSNAGLKAELFWLEDGQANAYNSSDLIARGRKSDRTLFLSQLNTPTRMFDVGFNNDLGEPVKTDAGQKLIERFAMRFTTVFRLAADQDEGIYELALLSDDGATMRLRGEDGNYAVAVDNDGQHPTRFGCGSMLVDMKRDTEKMMQVDYYQGPRYHIAMIAMMRKAQMNSDGTLKKDPACGVSGNDTFFNPNTQVPKPAYNDLLVRGWKPLSKDNFALANEATFNPCKDGEIAVISNLSVSETLSDGLIVSWTTDIATTSQLVVSGGGLAESITTVSDNVLRKEHRVSVYGLNASTSYLVQAVAISDTYGKSISNPVLMTTAD